MSLLFLDLGTKTGWALAKDGKVYSGVKDFSEKKREAGTRYLLFGKWLREMHSLYPITSVHYEDVKGHKGTCAAHVYGGFLAHLLAWAVENKIKCNGVHVSHIKKHATGKGNAKKCEMIEYAKSIGHAVVDDNHADALCLMHYVMRG